MKLGYERLERVFFLFISLSVLLLSLKNTQKIDLNLFYIIEQIILFGTNNLFSIISHPLIMLILLCILDIILGVIFIILVITTHFLSFFVPSNLKPLDDYLRSLSEYLVDNISDSLFFSSSILDLISKYSNLNSSNKNSCDLLKSSALLFISGGLLFVSLLGEYEGFAFLVFFFYLIILIKIRSEELSEVISYGLSKEVIYGLPYLVFIPHIAYLFGTKGATFGCLFLCIINYLILYEYPFSYYHLCSYLIYSIAYLILVPICTFLGGVVGTITCCIVIYLAYILSDKVPNKGSPHECKSTVTRVDPRDY